MLKQKAKLLCFRAHPREENLFLFHGTERSGSVQGYSALSPLRLSFKKQVLTQLKLQMPLQLEHLGGARGMGKNSDSV